MSEKKIPKKLEIVKPLKQGTGKKILFFQKKPADSPVCPNAPASKPGAGTRRKPPLSFQSPAEREVARILQTFPDKGEAFCVLISTQIEFDAVKAKHSGISEDIAVRMARARVRKEYPAPATVKKGGGE